jgi:hypothetical protein
MGLAVMTGAQGAARVPSGAATMNARGFDAGDARTGLALLRIQARASEPALQPGWVNRRVQQLEFLDTRAVRWRVSIDFEVPSDAPSIWQAGQQFYLVPITSMAKSDLVAFDLRDEMAAAVWMPTSRQTAEYLASALVYWAAGDLRRRPEDLPDALVADIWRVVSDRPAQIAADPPALLSAAAVRDARRRLTLAVRQLADSRAALKRVPAWKIPSRRRAALRRRRAEQELRAARRAALAAEERFARADAGIRLLAYRLIARELFRSRIRELAQNYVVHVGASTPIGSRRIIKLSYESEIRFARPKSRLRRFWQSLGWRAWQVDVLIGGSGGSHHLEVTAPPGVDIVGITADPVLQPPGPDRPPWHRRLASGARRLATARGWAELLVWHPAATYAVSGYAPHVHIHPPDAATLRYRAAIFVRVSRPGWLTQAWLVALVIAAVIGIGRFNLPTVYTAANGEPGTAATLLLALLGVFATMLLHPGEHPLASRLLLMARLLIFTQVGAVLFGVGDLVLHNTRHPVPAALWTWLAVIAAVAAILFTVSWLLPVARRPHRE